MRHINGVSTVSTKQGYSNSLEICLSQGIDLLQTRDAGNAQLFHIRAKPGMPEIDIDIRSIDIET